MALTILEAAKLSGEVKREAIVEMFARESDIIRELPFKPIAGRAYAYTREGQLPGVAFRGVNESYTESTGVLNPLVDVLAIAGGDLDVDKVLVKTDQTGTVRETQESLKVKALAQAWANAFIKGDASSDPRYFDGLQMRVTGTQLLAAGNTANGDALSLAKLDALIDLVDQPTHLIMNKSLRRRLSVAARTPTVAGYITYTADQFGRRVTSYNGIPILVAYEGGGGTEILPFTEACPGGGTNTGSSVYVVSFGDGYLTGIQNGEMMVTDLGELQTKPVMRTRVEWYSGIAIEHGRSAARLWGVSDAAIVA